MALLECPGYTQADVAKWKTCLPAGRRVRSHNMYSVYVLRSSIRPYLYVGITNNLERRVKQHQDGKEQTTRSYRPFLLVYTEHFSTRQEARDKEKYLKSGSGKEWLKNYLTESDAF